MTCAWLRYLVSVASKNVHLDLGRDLLRGTLFGKISYLKGKSGKLTIWDFMDLSRFTKLTNRLNAQFLSRQIGYFWYLENFLGNI